MSSGQTPHVFTIKAVEETLSDAGAVVRTYTTGARGNLPKTVRGRAIRLKNSPLMDHGVRGELQKWSFQTPTNPHMNVGDQVVFDYGGETITTKVVMGSVGRIDGTSKPRFWVAGAEEDSTEA